MKRRPLLVVGDSFMSRDPDYPGQHWSELMPEWQVTNRARPGWSNALIFLEVAEAIEQAPDTAIVLGFTDPLRIEFAARGRHGQGVDWVTNNHAPVLTADERLARDYFHITRDLRLEAIKSAQQILGLFSLLSTRGSLWAYSLMAYEQFLVQLPEVMKLEFQRYATHMIPYNLAEEGRCYWGMTSPRYHVNDAEMQQSFARAANSCLITQAQAV
jgi:hypothetical protein